MTDSEAKPVDHAEIIALWPSLAEFAAAIAVDYGTAKQMRRRKSIPDEYRPAVVADAAARGIAGITFELLTTTAPARRQRGDDG